jgi:hypothetical protein
MLLKEYIVDAGRESFSNLLPMESESMKPTVFTIPAMGKRTA